VISTGAISFDAALGVGGVPRGPRRSKSSAQSHRQNDQSPWQVIGRGAKGWRHGAFVDAEHAALIRLCKKLGVDVDNLLVSQPDMASSAGNR